MLNILKCWKLTLKIVRLAIHEDVVDKYNAEDRGPQVQVTEQQHKSYILSNTEKVCVITQENRWCKPFSYSRLKVSYVEGIEQDQNWHL